VLELKKFVVGPLRTNVYLLINELSEGILVDAGPGSFYRVLYLIDRGLIKLRYILLTHAHFDHASDAQYIKEVTDAKIVMHIADKEMFINSSYVAHRFGVKWIDPEIDIYILNDCLLKPLEIDVEVITTPGHTPGSICYYIPELHILFTGDTLLRGTIGKPDIYRGNEKLLSISLSKLKALPPYTRVLPGHGDETSLDAEFR